MRSYPETRSGKLLIGLAIFNYRAQQVIENSIGIIDAWWKMLCKSTCAEKRNVTSFMVVGVVLHNFLLQAEKASYCPRGFADYKPNDEFWPGEGRRIVRDDVGCFMHIERYGRSQFERNKGNPAKMRDDFKDYRLCQQQ